MAEQSIRGSRFLSLNASGSTVIVEVYDDMPQAGPVSRRGDVFDTGKSLEAALQQLTAIIDPLKVEIRKQLEEAETVTVEFGVKITAGAGVVIARSELEGNFKISLTWKK
jgi:hypothetical protein